MVGAAILLAWAAVPGTAQEVALEAAWPFGDPNALAVSPDETRLYSGEGASIAVLDVSELPLTEASVLARVPVEASILALLCTDEEFWVAGGRFGLLVSERARLGEPWRTLDDPEGLACTDVARDAGWIYALFAARDASELRVYDEATGERVGALPLGAGTALAIAARGWFAYVALGTGGLARVQRMQDDTLLLAPGPGAEAFPAPEGVRIEPMVRDVAISPTHVLAAADGAGLLAIARDDEWGPDVAVALTPIVVGGRRNYASRVAAERGWILVGSHAAPVAVQEGAPYTALGWINHRLEVGGVARDRFPAGAGEALTVFEDRADGPAERWVLESGGGWRTLELGARRVYEQHIGTGLRIRALPRPRDLPASDAPAPPIVAERVPSGAPAVDGVVSLSDPSLVLFGMDSAGSRPATMLRLAEGRLEAVPEVDIGRLGLTAGAQWIDPDHGDEWLVAGGDLGWFLYRVDAEHPARTRRWALPSQPAPDGGRGHSYYFSAVDGDVLYLTRSSTGFGLFGVSAAALAATARDSAEEPDLLPAPLFEVRTQERGARTGFRTWRVDPFEASGGRRVVAAAQGFEPDPDHERFEHALLALYEVTRAAEGEVVPLGRVHGPEPQGLAVAVAVAPVGERRFACLADLTHGLVVVEVTRPEEPAVVAEWRTPVNPFDGRREQVLDVGVEPVAAGEDGRQDRFDVWLACGRMGLVRLAARVGDDGGVTLHEEQVLRTPGFAEGVCLADLPDGRRVVVGDQKCGLRVYR